MKSILLVEDDEYLVNIMAKVLEEEGYRVHKSLSAEEALRFCREYTPDLIISDVKMGEMDGFALLEKIHTIATLKHIPFVFLTALQQSFGVRKASELGATAYITKPFELDDFIRAIKQILPA